jgi:outer membrane protein
MKRVSGILTIVIILACAIQNAGAQNFKFGYINRDELFKSIPEYDSATVKIEKFRQELINQLESMQTDLNKKTADFNDGSKTMSDAIRKFKEQDMKDLNTRIQVFQLQANQQVTQKNNELLQPIVTKVDKAIKQVSEEQGFTFVFDASVLYYFNEKKSTNLIPLVRTKLGLK